MYAYPLKSIKPKYFSLTGLILGSMAPDFEYFIMLEPYSWIGHSMAGLFFEALPLCTLLALIFHYIVKDVLAIHLPAIWQLDQRAYQIRGAWNLRGPRAWLIFLGSVALGFATHVLIDAFTHVSGYFVVRYAILREAVVWNIPVYKILQHSLSLLGLIVIGYVILTNLFRSNPNNSPVAPCATKKQKLQYWSIVIAIALAVTCIKLLLTSSQNQLGILVVAPVSGAVVGIIVASIRNKMIRSIGR
ncbi:DUF4184 family protein [Paenibacillus guangzhouensis]|uniref:DUF4184 family protein n=1 Tax=Paenibacillus guangzhouensis TaxID=1473112 RepID=UPI0022393004|nr:DUF4184 family protein [Paenibacillus guangzhouensis]